MRIIDISRPLDENTAVWPGDIPFSLDWRWRISGKAPVNLASITTTPHAGTHVDAPVHIRDGTAGIGEIPLEPFVGPARVVAVTAGDDGRIGPEALGSADLSDPPRILLKTGSWPDSTRWNRSFAHLAPEAAERLVREGALLVGIDTPGVDRFDREDLPSHNILLDGGLRWIESLDLSHVEPGLYELIALPLRICGGDGSPVRAVLVER